MSPNGSIIQIFLSSRSINDGTQVEAAELPPFTFFYFEETSFDDDDVCAGINDEVD